MEITALREDRTQLSLVGKYVEVKWAPTHSLANRLCEQCVYTVRGHEKDLICVHLVYDAVEGMHRNEAIFWVPLTAVQYIRVLSDREAIHRIDLLERLALDNLPKD